MRLKKYEFNCVNSTNDTAIKLIQKGNEKGIIFSDKQKKGKGRYGKKWISIKGNLFVSIFFQIKNIYKLKNINKKNCKILKSLLSKYVNNKIEVKYPNDLLINKKKICGILHETIFFKEKKYLIIGIGININNHPSIKKYKTGNLSQFTKKKISKLILFNNIKKTYEKKY
tara:strand:- start:3433 stop:3942 length:510 start_codon:yes stop_codon:yes gene_type:complete